MLLKAGHLPPKICYRLAVIPSNTEFEDLIIVLLKVFWILRPIFLNHGYESSNYFVELTLFLPVVYPDFDDGMLISLCIPYL